MPGGNQQANGVAGLLATARLLDEAGVEVLLVGDSLGMVMLGHETTLPVTVDEMLHHTRAVRKGTRRALVVADMPFGSYHADISESVRNAVRFVKEAGAEAVKVEGGERRLEFARQLVLSHGAASIGESILTAFSGGPGVGLQGQGLPRPGSPDSLTLSGITA